MGEEEEEGAIKLMCITQLAYLVACILSASPACCQSGIGRMFTVRLQAFSHN